MHRQPKNEGGFPASVCACVCFCIWAKYFTFWYFLLGVEILWTQADSFGLKTIFCLKVGLVLCCFYLLFWIAGCGAPQQDESFELCFVHIGKRLWTGTSVGENEMLMIVNCVS